jgi:hypothetical protein
MVETPGNPLGATLERILVLREAEGTTEVLAGWITLR